MPVGPHLAFHTLRTQRGVEVYHIFRLAFRPQFLAAVAALEGKVTDVRDHLEN